MRCLGAIVLTVSFGLAYAQPPTTQLEVAKDASVIHMHVVHKFHRVNGVSRQVEGRARLLPEGHVQVEVRVPAGSFATGNVNRDAAMKEAIEAARYPEIDLKAAADSFTLPEHFPEESERQFTMLVTFHGVQQELEVPVKITFDSESRARARASFQVSLDAFKVKRPSLMFVKVDDALGIDADLVFERQAGE
jgi:hypothetical protein